MQITSSHISSNSSSPTISFRDKPIFTDELSKKIQEVSNQLRDIISRYKNAGWNDTLSEKVILWGEATLAMRQEDPLERIKTLRNNILVDSVNHLPLRNAILVDDSLVFEESFHSSWQRYFPVNPVTGEMISSVKSHAFAQEIIKWMHSLPTYEDHLDVAVKIQDSDSLLPKSFEDCIRIFQRVQQELAEESSLANEQSAAKLIEETTRFVHEETKSYVKEKTDEIKREADEDQKEHTEKTKIEDDATQASIDELNKNIKKHEKDLTDTSDKLTKQEAENTTIKNGIASEMAKIFGMNREVEKLGKEEARLAALPDPKPACLIM